MPIKCWILWRYKFGNALLCRLQAYKTARALLSLFFISLLSMFAVFSIGSLVTIAVAIKSIRALRSAAGAAHYVLFSVHATAAGPATTQPQPSPPCDTSTQTDQLESGDADVANDAGSCVDDNCVAEPASFVLAEDDTSSPRAKQNAHHTPVECQGGDLTAPPLPDTGPHPCQPCKAPAGGGITPLECWLMACSDDGDGSGGEAVTSQGLAGSGIKVPCVQEGGSICDGCEESDGSEADEWCPPVPEVEPWGRVVYSACFEPDSSTTSDNEQDREAEGGACGMGQEGCPSAPSSCASSEFAVRLPPPPCLTASQLQELPVGAAASVMMGRSISLTASPLKARSSGQLQLGSFTGNTRARLGVLQSPQGAGGVAAGPLSPAGRTRARGCTTSCHQLSDEALAQVHRLDDDTLARSLSVLELWQLRGSQGSNARGR